MLNSFYSQISRVACTRLLLELRILDLQGGFQMKKGVMRCNTGICRLLLHTGLHIPYSAARGQTSIFCRHCYDAER